MLRDLGRYRNAGMGSISFPENHDTDRLMEECQGSKAMVRQIGKNYQYEDAFLSAAKSNFEYNKKLIAELFNADYPRLYMEEAAAGHWNNLSGRYRKPECVPEQEHRLLTGEDAPPERWHPPI